MVPPFSRPPGSTRHIFRPRGTILLELVVSSLILVVVIMAIDKRRGKIVGRPDIVSRGFIETGETEDLLEQIRDLVVKTLDHGSDHPIEWSFINTKVKETLSRFLYQQTKRRPMILSLAVEV